MVVTCAPDPASTLSPHRHRTVSALGLLLGLGAWCALIATAPAHSTAGREQLPNLARTLESGLFLVAGVLYLASYRLTSEPRTARLSAALLLLGATMPMVAAIGPLLGEPHDLAQTAPSTQALSLIPVFTLLLRSADAAPQRTAASPARRLDLQMSSAGMLGIGAMLLARQLGNDDVRLLWPIIATSTAGCWLLAAQRASQSTRDAPEVRAFVTAGYVLLATAQLVRASSVAGTAAAVGIAPGFELAAALHIISAAARSLQHAHAREAAKVAAAMKGTLDTLEAAEHERLHDVRSAVVGVLGASELLSSRSAAVEPHQLRTLIAAELKRLQAMLDLRSAEPVIDFDLAEALAPVILIHQFHGHAVDTDVQNARVLGRPRATATVLDNLLRNAIVHAPGARIWVRTERSRSALRLIVEDDGPGIPVSEQRAVLCRGVRGSRTTAPGEGLGLYTSAVAMRAQSGTLEVDDRPGGGARVTLTLPVAAAVPQPLVR